MTETKKATKKKNAHTTETKEKVSKTLSAKEHPAPKHEEKTHLEKKHETKAEIKKEHSEKKHETEKEVKKEIKKKKFILEEKKENKTKSKEAKEIQKTLDKKRLPTFRGRFGKKNIRRKSKKKWQKWRKPRSIDLDRGLQHGFRPKIGYRTKAETRGLHPSGYKEIRVENLNDLEKVNIKTEAIRIGATVGKRKRNDIVKKANEKGIWILN